MRLYKRVLLTTRFVFVWGRVCCRPTIKDTCTVTSIPVGLTNKTLNVMFKDISYTSHVRSDLPHTTWHWSDI